MYQHASPIRYPYLVTVESGSSVANDPHGPDGSYLVGSLLEDVEMIDDAETSITSSDDLVSVQGEREKSHDGICPCSWGGLDLSVSRH